ncbi:MAG: hypothetical protein ACXVB9_19000 [Bdellovibrionota bacterium]
MNKLAEVGVLGFTQNCFRLFDEYESLVLAYLSSPFGQEPRAQFRHKLSMMITAKLKVETNFPSIRETLKKVALICTQINAKIWHDIRIDYGFTGAEMGEAVKWAVDALEVSRCAHIFSSSSWPAPPLEPPAQSGKTTPASFLTQ